MGVEILRIKTPPIILDNTIVTRFALLNRYDILHDLYAKQLVVPTNVILEAISMQSVEIILRNALKNGWIEEYSL